MCAGAHFPPPIAEWESQRASAGKPEEPAMSVLDAFDATRLCSRWSSGDDPSVWVIPGPPVPIRASTPPPEFSWGSFVRNPYALIVSGVVGTMAAFEAVRGSVPPLSHR